ncbi:unnamed protein product [Chondrus crispus]|uniref:Uncharacterized protein n=1 Tax=Chondrus crispus TaxID=2769 RepID=R7QHR6_CHOCR|nr:unnamed protein product [Chondrus crispus]CDF37318.1 unnamed protein product [Chondrus crispus]|eukprot:XP_005717137.1 unnamed protein product [Chondrus crispus]
MIAGTAHNLKVRCALCTYLTLRIWQSAARSTQAHLHHRDNVPSSGPVLPLQTCQSQPLSTIADGLEIATDKIRLQSPGASKQSFENVDTLP